MVGAPPHRRHLRPSSTLQSPLASLGRSWPFPHRPLPVAAGMHICRVHNASMKRLKLDSWLLTEEILQVKIKVVLRMFLLPPAPPEVQGWLLLVVRQGFGRALHGRNFASCEAEIFFQL